jgi:hypothetical protein
LLKRSKASFRSPRRGAYLLHSSAPQLSCRLFKVSSLRYGNSFPSISRIFLGSRASSLAAIPSLARLPAILPEILFWPRRGRRELRCPPTQRSESSLILPLPCVLSLLLHPAGWFCMHVSEVWSRVDFLGLVRRLLSPFGPFVSLVSSETLI